MSKSLAQVLEETFTRCRVESQFSAYDDEHYAWEIYRALTHAGFVIVRPIRFGDLG